MTHVTLTAAGALVALAVAVPAAAQGRSGPHKPAKPSPPSQSALAPSTAAMPPSSGAVPFAWIDDASLLEPARVSLSISALRWEGSGLSEVVAPVIGVSVGVARHFQIGASVPRIGSSDPSGALGGVGTTYINGKIGVGTSDTVKFAVAPTIEVLGTGAVQALAPGESRVQFGVPVSVDSGTSPVRAFGSAGVFTPGIWFVGGGLGADASSRVSVAASISRAWTTATTASGEANDRNAITGTIAVSPTPQLSVYASIGRTFATSVENGAGTTVGGGVLFMFSAKR